LGLANITILAAPPVGELSRDDPEEKLVYTCEVTAMGGQDDITVNETARQDVEDGPTKVLLQDGDEAGKVSAKYHLKYSMLMALC